MDRRPPRLIANDFSTLILSNGVVKSEPLSDSALILRERELRDREERLRRRELEFERSQAVCSTRTSLVLIMPAMKLNLNGLRWMSAWVLILVSGILAQCQRLRKIVC